MPVELRKKFFMKDKERNRPAMFALAYGSLMAIICMVLMLWCENYTEERYALEEIDSGVYAIKSQGLSASSMRTYDTLELCIDGTLKTFNGTITISYTEGGPYAVVEINGFKNRDKVHAYIPKGTLKRGCRCGAMGEDFVLSGSGRRKADEKGNG